MRLCDSKALVSEGAALLKKGGVNGTTNLGPPCVSFFLFLQACCICCSLPFKECNSIAGAFLFCPISLCKLDSQHPNIHIRRWPLMLSVQLCRCLWLIHLISLGSGGKRWRGRATARRAAEESRGGRVWSLCWIAPEIGSINLRTASRRRDETNAHTQHRNGPARPSARKTAVSRHLRVPLMSVRRPISGDGFVLVYFIGCRHITVVITSSIIPRCSCVCSICLRYPCTAASLLGFQIRNLSRLSWQPPVDSVFSQS